MEFIYTFFITFFIIFFSELGDKTQLLVLSFSTKNKTKNILLGVAIGTFLSHGSVILFGSKIGSFNNETFNYYLKVFTYASFLLFGIFGFLPKKEKIQKINDHVSKPSFLEKISNLKLNYIIIIAISIFIGELGDKTLLASLGVGLQYPHYKISLILGSIFGMVISDFIAILFGKFLGSKLNKNFIEIISNLIFITFGLLGFLQLFLFIL